MKIISLRVDATGSNVFSDEILQLCIVDGDGNPLFFSRFKPIEHTRWDDAEIKTLVSPSNVANCLGLFEYRYAIESLLSKADLIVGDGISDFDLPLLFSSGITSTIREDAIVIDTAQCQRGPAFLEDVDLEPGALLHDPFARARGSLWGFYRLFGDPPEIPAAGCGIYHNIGRQRFHYPKYRIDFKI